MLKQFTTLPNFYTSCFTPNISFMITKNLFCFLYYGDILVTQIIIL